MIYLRKQFKEVFFKKRTNNLKSITNNDIYRLNGFAWWDEDEGMFSTIRFFVNPIRFNFFLRILTKQKDKRGNVITILDIGCGGGILSEEFARAGYKVIGIDPANESIETARSHAKESGLSIEYMVASGENLPFDNQSFDVILCCDVLEHVDNVNQVISEIARVLKPGGTFFFDTINRTFESKIVFIYIMQEWRATAFAPRNAHVWEQFIKPVELSNILSANGLINQEFRGISSGGNPVLSLLNFYYRVKGKISFRELGQRLHFHESTDLHASYMGYAIKPIK